MTKRTATEKAPRNRTISVGPEERDELVHSISAQTGSSHSIIHGDAFSILPTLEKGFYDMLFVDPPYNLSRSFGTEEFRRIADADYEAWMDSWLRLCVPLLRSTATVYICGDWRSSSSIQNAGSRYFRLLNRITWEREKGRGAQRNWKNAAEDIWVFTVSAEYTFNLDAVKQRRRVLAPYRENGRPKDWNEMADGNFRDTHPSNIWTDISVPFWSMPENTDHPTQKPEKLLAKMILASTNAGDAILDPFGGSGTTAVAAKKLGRRCTLIESDEDHCIVAAKRLRLADNDNRIQGFSDGVFWERNAHKRSAAGK